MKDDKDYENIEYINRGITTIGSISIAHKVSVYKAPKKGSNDPQQYHRKQCSSYTFAGKLGYPSYFCRETKDYIVLQEGIAATKTVEEYERQKENITYKKRHVSVLLTYADVDNIKTTFDIASNWFIDEKYRNNLFLYDQSGIPYGLSHNFDTLSVLTNLTTGKGSFLSIQPAVVLDALNSIGYPGVVLKCSSGILGTCTMAEFFSLKRIVIHLLDNLYTNTLCLLNHLYILQKQGEKEDYVIY